MATPRMRVDRDWLNTDDTLHATVTATPPADMHTALPLIVCSLAPGGGYDEDTR